MAVSALVDTPGAANANVYVTLAFADQYFADRLNTDAWTGDDNKKKALIQATRDIDALTFTGYKYYTGNDAEGNPLQALEFPRRYNASSSVEYLATGLIIPVKIKMATCEQALYLLKQAAQSSDFGDSDKIKEFSRGGVSVTFKDSSGFRDLERRRIAPAAEAHLREYMQMGNGVKLVR